MPDQLEPDFQVVERRHDEPPDEPYDWARDDEPYNHEEEDDDA